MVLNIIDTINSIDFNPDVDSHAKLIPFRNGDIFIFDVNLSRNRNMLSNFV